MHGHDPGRIRGEDGPGIGGRRRHVEPGGIDVEEREGAHGHPVQGQAQAAFGDLVRRVTSPICLPEAGEDRQRTKRHMRMYLRIMKCSLSVYLAGYL